MDEEDNPREEKPEASGRFMKADDFGLLAEMQEGGDEYRQLKPYHRIGTFNGFHSFGIPLWKRRIPANSARRRRRRKTPTFPP